MPLSEEELEELKVEIRNPRSFHWKSKGEPYEEGHIVEVLKRLKAEGSEEARLQVWQIRLALVQALQIYVQSNEEVALAVLQCIGMGVKLKVRTALRLLQIVPKFPSYNLMGTKLLPKNIPTGILLGEVKDLRSLDHEAIIHVFTDQGALVPKTCEVLIDNLQGCFALFAKGDGVGLAHLTPSTKLPYEPEHIERSLPQLAAFKKVSRALTLFGVRRTYGNVESELKQVAAALEQQGFTVRIMPLNVGDTTIYYSPEHPGRLIVIGNEFKILPTGKMDFGLTYQLLKT